MNEEIKFDHFENINDLLKNIDIWYQEDDVFYDRWFSLNDLKKLKDYITNLEQELKEANDSIIWWTNRFNAIQRENENLHIKLEDKANEQIKTMYEEYKSRIDKAVELVKSLIMFWKKYSPDNTMEIRQFERILSVLGGDEE